MHVPNKMVFGINGRRNATNAKGIILIQRFKCGVNDIWSGKVEQRLSSQFHAGTMCHVVWQVGLPLQPSRDSATLSAKSLVTRQCGAKTMFGRSHTVIPEFLLRVCKTAAD